MNIMRDKLEVSASLSHKNVISVHLSWGQIMKNILHTLTSPLRTADTHRGQHLPLPCRNIFLFLLISGILPFGACKPPSFVFLEPGTFVMGSPVTENHRDNDEALHEVFLTRSFQIQATEVTQHDYESIMGANPSYFPHHPERPVEQVSWFDAIAYTIKRSVAEGLPPCYSLASVVCRDDLIPEDPDDCISHGGIKAGSVSLNAISSVYDCEGYRLPTEAEWEYAARAGTVTSSPAGDIEQPGCFPVDLNLSSIAWYCGNSIDMTHRVAQKAPNPWGLYDMAGNVAEWCWDGYAVDYRTPVSDPQGPATSHFKVVRGGAVKYSGPPRCRSADRAGHSPGFSSRYVGFRISRSISHGSAPPASAKFPFRDTPLKPPSGAYDIAGPVLAKPVDVSYPGSLPFEFTRPDEGIPLSQEEISALTRKITGFWKNNRYFDWILSHSHGMATSAPGEYPDYKLYWQDTRAIKTGSEVTFEHFGGADNLMIRTSKVLNNAAAGYLMSGSPQFGRIVEQYSKGIIALFRGMQWDAQDPESTIMARSIFTQDHTYSEGDRTSHVKYGPAKVYKQDWNAHTIENPNNPYWGTIWVRNMRSKDDVPHILRTLPLLMRVAQQAPDVSVAAAASQAVRFLEAFSADIVKSGYYIRTKDKEGNACIPINPDNGLVNDLASFVEYVWIVPDAECNARLVAALAGYQAPLDVECGNGIGPLYEIVATYQHYFNYAIIRYFHIAAITNALMVGQYEIAEELLSGLALRADKMVLGEGNRKGYVEWDSDVASFLLAAATGGLPLTAHETRLITEEYSHAVDHYAPWPHWDMWQPSEVEGDEIDYLPSRNIYDSNHAVIDAVVRPTELAYFLEYCHSPFRNPSGSPLVDCSIIEDPIRWGE